MLWEGAVFKIMLAEEERQTITTTTETPTNLQRDSNSEYLYWCRKCNEAVRMALVMENLIKKVKKEIEIDIVFDLGFY